MFYKVSAAVPCLLNVAQFKHKFNLFFQVVLQMAAACTIVAMNLLIVIRIMRSHLRKLIRSHLTKFVDTDDMKKRMCRNLQTPAYSPGIILLTSSMFYLMTSCLDLFLCVLSVLARYPVCLVETQMDYNRKYDPARQLLRHVYFAFGFLFYVCLQVRNYRKRLVGISRSSTS